MKKAEELKLYAPEPKRPELDAALCMSVAEGQGVGRYIKGKVLTVAVWDKKEKPLVVWRFFGGYWTGELRGNENPKKNELSPRQIEVKPCQCLTWRTEVPATKGESELLQNYFDDRRPGYLIGIVEDALSAHAKKKREERNARQAAETQKLFENLPEPPEDFSKQVLKVCSDAGFLWVTNDKQGVIEPGGVEKKILIQRARCDSCGGEYTPSELLKHKSTAVCECCGEKMRVRNTRYSVKRLWAARTFLWCKPQGDGIWIRRYLVYFDFSNHRAEPEFHGRGIWWTDGKSIKQWKRSWGEKTEYIMCQRPKLSAMLLAPSGPYQPYTLASHTDQFENDVRKVLKSEWMYQYDNHLNFPWEVRQWEIVNRYPMAESLVKTGWADALCSQVYDRYEHGTRINLRAKTYYGVFGLNRQELAAVSQSKKSFREVDNALEWKDAGLAINGKNMAMTANIRNLSGMAKTLQKSGMTRSLKYLRQQTRRITGSYNGHIALRVAQDWSDYLDMAEKAGMNMQLESVMFPLDLKRRHDDLVLERNKQHRMEAMKGTQHSIRREAEQLEKQFHIENIYKKIRKIYEYDGAEYIIRVPEGAKDILQESKFLDHCIQRGTRYFERISVRESYIFFLRKKSDPNTPWYTLEVEPGGTVRQKRSYSNDQYADLEDAKPFIEEWQQVVQGRMTASEISFAKQSKEIRAQEFAELKENGNIIRTGANAGKLLVDELMHDLMEVEKRVG